MGVDGAAKKHHTAENELVGEGDGVVTKNTFGRSSVLDKKAGKFLHEISRFLSVVVVVRVSAGWVVDVEPALTRRDAL